jgi:hypothetical protein
VDVFSVLLTLSLVQTTHPPNDRVIGTDNTSTKRQGEKYRQHIHQKKGSKVQKTHPPLSFGGCVVCSFDLVF